MTKAIPLWCSVTHRSPQPSHAAVRGSGDRLSLQVKHRTSRNKPSRQDELRFRDAARAENQDRTSSTTARGTRGWVEVAKTLWTLEPPSPPVLAAYLRAYRSRWRPVLARGRCPASVQQATQGKRRGFISTEATSCPAGPSCPPSMRADLRRPQSKSHRKGFSLVFRLADTLPNHITSHDMAALIRWPRNHGPRDGWNHTSPTRGMGQGRIEQTFTNHTILRQ